MSTSFCSQPISQSNETIYQPTQPISLGHDTTISVTSSHRKEKTVRSTRQHATNVCAVENRTELYNTVLRGLPPEAKRRTTPGSNERFFSRSRDRRLREKQMHATRRDSIPKRRDAYAPSLVRDVSQRWNDGCFTSGPDRNPQ